LLNLSTDPPWQAPALWPQQPGEPAPGVYSAPSRRRTPPSTGGW